MTRTVPKGRVDLTGSSSFVDGDDLDVRRVARLRVEVGVGLVDDGDAPHQVELVDQVLVTLVQVDRSRMQRAVGAMLVGRAEQLPGVVDDDRVDVPRSGSDVDGAVRILPPPVEPGVLPAHQLSALAHALHGGADVAGLSEEGELPLAERELPGGASQVRFEHVGIRRVDHRSLGRFVEQVLRVMHQVLIQWVVLRHEHRERIRVATPCASGLLPHGRARSRVAREDRGIQ